MRSALLGLVGLAAACGHDAGAADACASPRTVTLDVSGPDLFRCHEPYRATFTVSNMSCETIAVTSVEIVPTVVSATGNCTASAPSTYEPTVGSIAAGKIAIVADVTGAPFCCAPAACPVDYECDERYDFTVVTSAGRLTQSVSPVHIELPECDVICP